MTLAEYITELETDEPTLVMANRRRTTQPLLELVADMFDEQPVAVRVADLADVPEDQMVVLKGGEIIATSPINDFLDAVLFADATVTTGERSLSDAGLPAVVEALAETKFVLEGAPSSNREKLLFIAISRYIERLAYEQPGGTLRVGFQHLSRMRDERGTESAYRQLGAADLDVHVYGVPDWVPDEEYGVTMHGGYTPEFRDNWFVIYESPAELEGEPMALVSNQVEDNRWRGFWTSDPDLVSELAGYVAENL